MVSSPTNLQQSENMVSPLEGTFNKKEPGGQFPRDLQLLCLLIYADDMYIFLYYIT